MRLMPAVLTCLLLSLPALADAQQPVRGGYAVLHAPVNADLPQMRREGVNLVILQYTRGSGSIDAAAVQQFIDSAEAAGIDYMLGLYYPHTWENDWLAGRRIDRYVQGSVDLIQGFPATTGGHFRGWYLPMEFGNHRGADFRRLRRAFAPLVSVSAPLAVSIYFNPGSNYLEPAPFAAAVESVIGPFDIVLMQDGVGERAITQAEAEPYYAALGAVVNRGGRQLWAVVEGFQCHDPKPDRQCDDGDPRPPAPPGRICWQVAAVRPYTRGIIAYNFIEVLQPAGPGTEHQRVYREFIQAVLDRPCP